MSKGYSTIFPAVPAIYVARRGANTQKCVTLVSLFAFCFFLSFFLLFLLSLSLSFSLSPPPHIPSPRRFLSFIYMSVYEGGGAPGGVTVCNCEVYIYDFLFFLGWERGRRGCAGDDR